MQRAIIATLALAAAFTWQASAETTTMQVPQGSGTFPTIGQVECLEEMGSGRYCAATYECGNGSSGDLWGDMANHNGRRPIGADSPVSNQLDCTVEIDGKAAVQWFHGHRPTGREGDVVGLSPVVSAEPPTIRRDVRVTGGDGLWLPWYIRTRNVNLDDVRTNLREERCGHIKEGTEELDSCQEDVNNSISAMGLYANFLLTPVTMCATEMAELHLEDHPELGSGPFALELRVLRNPGISTNYGDSLLSVLDAITQPESSSRRGVQFWKNNYEEKYGECRELYNEQLIEFGLADPEE